VRAGAVGGIAIDDRPGCLLAPLAWGQVAKQRRADRGVGGGRRAHLGGADDLGVGIGRDVRLVAVKAVGGGLVAVACLRVDDWDHPVRRGALEDAEAPVIGLLNVLAGDRSQQRRGLGDARIQPLAPRA
jgi:hypothetical protein